MDRSHDGRGVVGGGVPARVRRRTAAAAVALGALAVGAVAAPAQVRAGGHGLYHSESFRGSDFGYGARVEVDLGFLAEQLAAGATFDVVPGDCSGCRYREVGARVGLAVVGQGGAGSFVGLGGSFSRSEQPGPGGTSISADDWRLALIASIRYTMKEFVTPFFELQTQLGDQLVRRLTLSFGVLLGPYGSGNRSRSSTRGTR